MLALPSWMPSIDSALTFPSAREPRIHVCIPRLRVWQDRFVSPIIRVDVWLMSGVLPDIITRDNPSAHTLMSVVD
jgi:hypothetical protein